MMILLVLLWLVHSDYPVVCCNGDKDSGDCRPVTCDSITETKSGYDWNGFHFRPDHVYPSFNDKCHACIYRKTVPMCLFIQESS